MFALENWLGGGNVALEFKVIAVCLYPSQWYPGCGLCVQTHTQRCVCTLVPDFIQQLEDWPVSIPDCTCTAELLEMLAFRHGKVSWLRLPVENGVLL